jgi:hypothetical protein
VVGAGAIVVLVVLVVLVVVLVVELVVVLVASDVEEGAPIRTRSNRSS